MIERITNIKTWVNVKNVMPSERSQGKENTYEFHTKISYEILILHL